MSYETSAAVNASLLKRVSVTLRHARHYIENGLADSAALIEGRMIDDAVFSPEKYASKYWVPDVDLRTKAGKAARADAEERGATVVSAKQKEKVDGMLDGLRSHPIAGAMLFGDHPRRTQVEMYWTWRDVQCKGKPDMIVDVDGVRWLVDLKSTSAPYPRQFSRDMAKFGYDLQLAFYADGCSLSGVGRVDKVAIIAVDKSPVHDVVVYELDEDHVLYHGREKYEAAIDALMLARKTGRWPGYAEDSMVQARLPEYAYSDDVELTYDGEEVAL